MRKNVQSTSLAKKTLTLALLGVITVLALAGKHFSSEYQAAKAKPSITLLADGENGNKPTGG
jgi:hypothetical protein